MKNIIDQSLDYLPPIEEMSTLRAEDTGLKFSIVIRKRPDEKHKLAYIDVVIDGSYYPFFVDTLEFDKNINPQPSVNSKALKGLKTFVANNKAGLISVFHQDKNGFSGISDGRFIINLVNKVYMSNFDFLDEDVLEYDFLKWYLRCV